MTAPAFLEKVRAALAEVGYPAEAVYNDGRFMRFKSRLVPREMVWRACCTAGSRLCWACFERWCNDQLQVEREKRALLDRPACSSLVPFAADCGADREAT